MNILSPPAYGTPITCWIAISTPEQQIAGLAAEVASFSRGIPHPAHVTTGNISDKAGAMEMLLFGNLT